MACEFFTLCVVEEGFERSRGCDNAHMNDRGDGNIDECQKQGLLENGLLRFNERRQHGNIEKPGFRIEQVGRQSTKEIFLVF